MMKNKKSIPGELWAVGAALGFTAANLFDKVGMASGNAFAALLYKDGLLLILAVIMCLRGGLYYKYLNKKSEHYCGPKGWLPFVFSGPIMDAFGTAVFYLAINAGGLVIAVPCIQAQVLWAALLARFIVKEPLNKHIVGGSIIFVGGLVLLNLGPSIATGITIEGNALLGAGLALLAGLAWAYSTVLWKQGLANGCDKWVGLSIHYPSCFITVFIYLALTGNLAAYNMSTQAKLSFMGSGVFSGLIAVNLFMTALRLAPVARVNVIKSSYPILLSILAWLLFDEYLNAWMLLGIVLTSCGVAIVNMRKEKAQVEVAA
jgi:drug/metabolite transporter (DMT)-like permease